jgi:antitoxin HicB
MLRYLVRLERDTNGTILAGFPDVPEAHTFGEDRDEALVRAADALETALMGYMEDRRAIPDPSSFKRGPYVALPALTEAKLALYSAMRAGRVNKTEPGWPARCFNPRATGSAPKATGSRPVWDARSISR